MRNEITKQETEKTEKQPEKIAQEINRIQHSNNEKRLNNINKIESKKSSQSDIRENKAMPVASFNDKHGQNAERLEKQNRISEYTKIEKATDANGEVNVYRMANDYFSKIDAIKADSRMSESEKIKALTSLGENVTVINNGFRESVEADMRDLYTEEYRVRREFYETHNIINAMETNMSVKSDISENESLESTLFLFEQSQWENISIYEKKVAIDKLCDCITEDLGINEKPEIRYYNGDISESGGYSREKNAIYINENTLISGCDVADTVAHEARHCWQHERAENPQNEQDYRLKESIENYVKPETDYEKYLSQFVETDAQSYASKITENIAVNEFSNDPVTVNHDKTENESFSKQNPEKYAVFDKPDDLNSKIDAKISETREVATLEQVAEATKEFGQGRFHDVQSYDDSLSETEKVKIKAAHEKTCSEYNSFDTKFEHTCNAEDIQTLKDARAKVDAPTENTIMLRVLSVDTYTQNVENLLDSENQPPLINGFAAKAEDSSKYCENYNSTRANLRLDYKYDNDYMPYPTETNGYFICKFTVSNPDAFTVPKSAEFCDVILSPADRKCEQPSPCTGTGYLSSEEKLIPEYVCNQGEVSSGAIFHIDKEGKEHCVAVYDSKNDRFIPTDYWKENFEERK